LPFPNEFPPRGYLGLSFWRDFKSLSELAYAYAAATPIRDCTAHVLFSGDDALRTTFGWRQCKFEFFELSQLAQFERNEQFTRAVRFVRRISPHSQYATFAAKT
jgi:hypothetical protein